MKPSRDYEVLFIVWFFSIEVKWHDNSDIKLYTSVGFFSEVAQTVEKSQIMLFFFL
jgi:hypothetical protein